MELTAVQRQMVTALMRDRDRVVAEANAALAQIQQALDELARMLADEAGLDGEGQLEFAQGGPGEPMQLRRRAPDGQAPGG